VSSIRVKLPFLSNTKIWNQRTAPFLAKASPSSSRLLASSSIRPFFFPCSLADLASVTLYSRRVAVVSVGNWLNWRRKYGLIKTYCPCILLSASQPAFSVFHCALFDR
jgi:hypothetical protein